ncbi:MAG: methyltransferase [Ktedonobacterales bacterium]
MRIGAIPTSLLEWAIERLDLAPVPAVEVMFGMLHSRAIMAGVELGIFAALQPGPASYAELATRLRLQPNGTRLLCDALVAARYLRRERTGRYRLRRRARRYLVPAAHHYVGHFVAYNYDQWDWVSHLEAVVRDGASLDVHHTLGQADATSGSGSWAKYMEGLADLAREAAPEIAAKVPMPPRRRGAPRMLLDVGGGHGIFSAALCRRYLDLRAEVLDLPACVAAGEPIARRYAGPDAAARVRYRTGDALVGPLGPDAGYDVALVFQLLHHLPPTAIPDLFARVVQALRPGGWVSVIDLLEPRGGQPPAALTAYSALYFHLTSGGESYTPEQVEAWLRGAGCRTVRRVPLLRVPGQSLIAGQRAP